MFCNARRLSRLALGLSAFSCVGAAPAFATQYLVSYMTVPYQETVSLVAPAGSDVPSMQNVIAGQQVLTVNYGTSLNPSARFTEYAWCVDITHDIYENTPLSTVYSTGPLYQNGVGATAASSDLLSATQIREIDGLAGYGDKLMQSTPSDTISAGVQVAIWSIEYGYTLAPGSNAALGAEVDQLLAIAPGLYPADGIAITSTSADGRFQSQGLLLVPEPASLALLGMGVAGLLAARRRPQAA